MYAGLKSLRHCYKTDRRGLSIGGEARQLYMVHLVVVLNPVTDWRGKRSPSIARPGCTGAG